MNRHITALISGLIFGLGLTVSGMVNPAKVVGFLDVAGKWDASLALVLIAAAGISALAFRSILKLEHPVFGAKFNLPSQTGIDFRLLVGAGLFGIGWGLVGLCPGPVFTTLLLGRWESYVFFVAMIAGMVAFRWLDAYAASNRIKSGVAS